MKKLVKFAALSAFSMSLFLTQVAVAQNSKEQTVMVGGAAMYPSKNIMENAVNSKDHTILVAAVKAAGLVETLSSKGPFTVFAPTNAAFELLPKGTVEQLVKPESKSALTKILTYHVVAGKHDAKSIWDAVTKGGGKTSLATVAGGMLTFWSKDNVLYVRDTKGTDAKITIGNVNQSNGVIHVIDKVLMP